jgi:hypothetical protein
MNEINNIQRVFREGCQHLIGGKWTISTRAYGVWLTGAIHSCDSDRMVVSAIQIAVDYILKVSLTHFGLHFTTQSTERLYASCIMT